LGMIGASSWPVNWWSTSNCNPYLQFKMPSLSHLVHGVPTNLQLVVPQL
jgi:hypothetical protein